MRIFFFYILLLLIGLSCNSSEHVTILMENNSDTKSTIEIVTYVNDTLYTKSQVNRNKEKVSYTEVTLKNLAKWGEKINLKFFISGSLDTTKCSVQRDSIKSNAIVHVNFNEVLFKKGDSYDGRILDQDTIIKKEFYSEIGYH